MRTSWLTLIGIGVLCVTPPVNAQTPPPIHGVTGTIATEGTIRDEHKAANKIVVETSDGVKHVYDGAKGLIVHGGKDNRLADLKPGTTVVVHYTTGAAGDAAQEIDRVGENGLSVTEGIVTDIDRGKKEITIRYDNGTIEKLKLTDRSAADAGTDVGANAVGVTRIVVYYSDEAGQKVAHYFKRKS
jgi:hypothetical protein